MLNVKKSHTHTPPFENVGSWHCHLHNRIVLGEAKQLTVGLAGKLNNMMWMKKLKPIITLSLIIKNIRW